LLRRVSYTLFGRMKMEISTKENQGPPRGKI
jgi:hypothetical protein